MHKDMDVSPKILVAAIGLNDESMSILNFLCKNLQKPKFNLTQDKYEQICIFHMDGSDIPELLRTYRKQFPNRQIIVIFKNEVKGNNIIGVRSPVTPRRLLDALNHAAIQLKARQPEFTSSDSLRVSKIKKQPVIPALENTRFFSSRSDIDLNSIEEVVKIRYSEERYLQGIIQSVLLKGNANNNNVQINSPYGVFKYYPSIHKVHVELKRYSLRNLASVPDVVSAHMTEPDDKNSFKEISMENLVCADALLWDLTIWASRGRLSLLMDLEQPFSLKNWPNFTRWRLTPHAMQITVFWMNNPVTLRETVAVLEIPQRYVFTFYCAVFALGLIVIDDNKQSNNKRTAVKKVPSKLKGFIGKLLDYVKTAGGEEV